VHAVDLDTVTNAGRKRALHDQEVKTRQEVSDPCQRRHAIVGWLIRRHWGGEDVVGEIDHLAASRGIATVPVEADQSIECARREHRHRSVLDDGLLVDRVQHAFVRRKRDAFDGEVRPYAAAGCRHEDVRQADLAKQAAVQREASQPRLIVGVALRGDDERVVRQQHNLFGV
jgi:hypothetical protein